LEDSGVPGCACRVPLVSVGVAVADAALVNLLVLLGEVGDDGEALEVGDALAVSVGDAG